MKRYGWKPDLPDQRDHVFTARRPSFGLPLNVDLRPVCPPVFDQGELGSCTANAIAAAHLFDQMKQHNHPYITPSRLFIYYNERAAEHTIKSDAGAAIRDGIKSIATLGVCAENLCPYDVAAFAKKPSASAYKAALMRKAVKYQAVTQTVDKMRACLASGFPFVFGISVYDSFESAAVAKSGIVNMPKPGEKMLGGHALFCVGYDHPSKRFICMNSWGVKWGQKGFFTIPYEYLAGQLASDMWVVQSVM